MRKRLAIIAVSLNYASFLHNQLKQLFKDNIEIIAYSYEVEPISRLIDADLYIITVSSLYHLTKKFIPKEKKVIIPSHTITKSQYDQIMNIPAGTSVMVVNDNYESTIQTITLFHNLEINHLDFVPYYTGMKNIPDLDIAITPGESHHIPSHVKKIIDIGNRTIDADSLTEIAISFDLKHLLSEEYFREYLQNIKIVKSSLMSLFDKTNMLEDQLLSLLNIMDDGIIITDSIGTVCACNNKALTVLRKENSIMNENISGVIPEIPFKEFSQTKTETKYKLIKVNNDTISIKAVPVISSGETSGTLIIINNFYEKEKNQHKLRTQLLGKGHKAKHTFDDIITVNDEYVQVKILAEKRAKSDASVLITGESGTGKEMFAQAIHNASGRKRFPFVAVNCAAIPDNLLESELFGYEEGAFTGARKGGKIGLFEIAHNGTIFLDEIGEMNYNLQARLLRVLEEREVMRIGGDSIIPINIRIITATNTDLWQLVEENKFRRDLFYRLNVLPLELPPLRERREDIPLLFEHISKAYSHKFTLSSAAKEILYNYSWYGNVRELKNCVEYLATMEKSFIDEKDLPSMIRKKITTSAPDKALNEELSDFFSDIRFEKENYLFVLDCLYTSYINKLRVGRRSILKLALEKEIILTEAQIRKILGKLELYGLAILSNGRGGGTAITTLGVKALKLLKSV